MEKIRETGQNHFAMFVSHFQPSPLIVIELEPRPVAATTHNLTPLPWRNSANKKTAFYITYNANSCFLSFTQIHFSKYTVLFPIKRLLASLKHPIDQHGLETKDIKMPSQWKSHPCSDNIENSHRHKYWEDICHFSSPSKWSSEPLRRLQYCFVFFRTISLQDI